MILKNNNKIFFLFLGFFSVMNISFAQTAVGKSGVNGKDVILDFKENESRGIILPWVTNQNLVTNVVGGTFIFDSNDKKIKYYRSGSTPKWEDLSVNSGQVDLSIQNSLTENNQKTILGNQASTTSGLLVLEANNKAMVLPKSDSPHLNVKSPAAGTMVYDKVSKMLCLFNGTEWSFWKINQ